jgi:1-acyl-sn-glycerol-3-phosphate acyltransferase
MKRHFLKKGKEKVHILVFIFLQYLLTPIFNRFYFYVFRICVIKPKNFSISKRGVLFISNHQSKVDPFIITGGVGIKNFIRSVCPTRYPVMSLYMQKPFTGKIIALIGGYDIGSTSFERMKQLVFTRDLLLHKKQNVLIFPEGKINKTIDVHHEDFQKGIQILFKENIPIVFVRLTGIHSITLSNFYKNFEKAIKYSEVIDNVSAEEKIKKMIDFYQ